MAKKRFPLYATLLTFFLLTGLVFVAAQDTGGAPPAPAGGSLDENAVVFELGDEQITAAQFETRFDVALRNLAAQQGIPLDSTTLEQFAGLRPAFLEQFATEQVLLQEAATRGLEPSDEEVEGQVEEARSSAGENYQTLLAESGFADEDALRQLIRESLTLQNVVESLEGEVTPDEAAVTEFYEANSEQFARPEEVCARHILVEDEATANELLERIEGGTNFAQVAQNNSTDPGSAQNGGDLGCLARGATVPPFEEAAFAAEVGETVGPVESDFGFHIIRVYERNPAETAPLDEVRAQIEQQLAGAELNSQVMALVEASGVQTYPENLPVTPPSAPPSAGPTPGETTTGGAMTGGAMTGGAMTEEASGEASTIIGSNAEEVSQLLADWRSEPSRASDLHTNYYDPDETVRLIVIFSPEDEAIGVSVVNLNGISIPEARVQELLTLTGGQNPNIVEYEGDIVEFHVGDMGLD